jgi:transcriptional regulator with XRE-family HTH domain
MAQKPLESLGALVRSKRSQRKLREVAREIGIGPATLLRVESGRIPDVLTFGKICKWLQVDPGIFLGFEKNSPSRPGIQTQSPSLLVFSGHLKAAQTQQHETIHALAQLLFLASQMQYQEPES